MDHRRTIDDGVKLPNVIFSELKRACPVLYSGGATRCHGCDWQPVSSPTTPIPHRWALSRMLLTKSPYHTASHLPFLLALDH